MLGIVAILVAIWFYNSAVKAGNGNVWQWVAAGVVIYYVAGVIWTYGLVVPLLGRNYAAHSAMTGAAIEISGILVALIVVAVVRSRFMMKR